MAVLNPYSNVQWQNVIYVPSCSHEHCAVKDLQNLYNGGLKHLAISNYHPSEPAYPLDEYFGVTIPEGIIGSPNSEFYNMDIRFFHSNALGSFATDPGENSIVDTWRNKFRKILGQMQYADGGGITLNHPAWTKAYAEEQQVSPKLGNYDLIDMLDFDDRVLGIEFYNSGNQGNTANMWDLDTWDYILKTGRRCWGFCVADHDGQSNDRSYVWRGRNILLCNEFTEHECLKAYREGRFYGSIYNTDLKFSSIELSGYTVSVVADNADHLEFVVDGVYHEVNGSSGSYNVPAGSTYVRVEAHNNDNSIFSQPIMFKMRSKKVGTDKKMLLILD